MSEAEKYINEHINYRSNFKPNGYHEWVTPDDALRACEIIKQETVKKACKWLEEKAIHGWIEDVEVEKFIEQYLKEIEL